MRFFLRYIWVLTVGPLMTACAPVPPSTILTQPTTMRSQPTLPGPVSPGAIYQTGVYRPLFEDQRARLVGDVLTIVISEKASADKKAAASSARKGAVETNPESIFGAPMTTLAMKAGGSNTFSMKEDGAAGSNFTTTLSVTVIEVLVNGNLIVSGEKQIGFDQGAEFIRFSGVVPTSAIRADNSVFSSQVADARLEYRSNTHVDKSQLASMLNRFFYSVFPL